MTDTLDPLVDPPDGTPPGLVPDWDMMDTAPKDGRDLLVVSPQGRQLVARWVDLPVPGWVIEGGRYIVPVSWRDLPEPPNFSASPEPFFL